MARPKFTSPEAVRKRYRERDRVIRAMGFPSYRAYLSSIEWRSIRADHIKDNPDCAVCESPADDVHHLSYSRAVLEGRLPKMLASVCSAHHHAIEFDGYGRKRSPIQAGKRLKQLIAQR